MKVKSFSEILNEVSAKSTQKEIMNSFKMDKVKGPYTALTIDMNGKFGGKELLNNPNEVEEWASKMYGKAVKIIVINDETGGYKLFDDNGDQYTVIKSGKTDIGNIQKLRTMKDL